MYIIALERKANGRIVYPRKEVAIQQRLRNSYEKKLYTRLIRTFSNIGAQVANDLERGQRNPISLENIDTQIGNVLVEHYRQVFNEFGTRTRQNFNRILRKETEFERYVQQYLYAVGGTKITQISETTRQQLVQIISKGHIDGLGQNPIARQIREYSQGSFTRYRSRMIARTETHQASIFANHRVSRDQEIPDMQKRWVSTNDNRTRGHHRKLNGTTVGMEEDFVFTVGINEYRMQHPADPRGGAINNINCRCVLAYIVPEDTVAEPIQTIQEPRQSPFGQTTEDELEFHENADWNTSSDAYKTIKYIDPVKLQYGVKRAFADFNSIAMGAKKGKILEHLQNETRKTTWRHEFGHVIDTNRTNAIKDVLRDKNLLFDLADGYKGTDYWSGFLSKDILRDRKHQKRYTVNEVSKNSNKELEKFGLTGIKRDKNGKIKFINTSELNKSDYDMSTKEIINKEFKGTGLDFDDLNELADGKLFERMKFGQFYINKRTREKIFSGEIRLKKMAIYLRNDDIKSFLTEMRGFRIFNDDLFYFSDYMEAISNARIGFGHGAGYYKNFYKIERGVTIGHTTEAIANYVALTGGPRAKVFKKLMSKYAPNMTKSFDEIFKSLAKGDTEAVADFLRGKALGK